MDTVPQGKHAEAEALAELSQAIHQKALGPEHSDVALSLSNRADVLYRQVREGKNVPLNVFVVPRECCYSRDELSSTRLVCRRVRGMFPG